MTYLVNIFNEGEVSTIKKEFTYCEDDEANLHSPVPGHQSFNFTDRNLNSTQHALLRNLSSRSIILAPFNTTRSNLNYDLASTLKDLIVEKHMLIKFGMRVKEIDKNYEMNNNCNLDNGVFNKFAQAAEKKAFEGIQ
jgi:hypothetical protein